jgi:predicted DCC family thiol-disulfide oxidoreductase YuxK
MEKVNTPRQTPAAQPAIAVYFDGGCPMCAKEIAHYQKLDTAGCVQWVDIAGPHPSCPIGYDQSTLLARFHVEEINSGRMLDGAAGFARLWREMPTPWKQLGVVASWAPVTWLLELGYRVTLKVRPVMARYLFNRA